MMRLEEGVGRRSEVQYTSPNMVVAHLPLEPATLGEGCCKGSNSPWLPLVGAGWRVTVVAGTRKQRSPVPFGGWCVELR